MIDHLRYRWLWLGALGLVLAARLRLSIDAAALLRAARERSGRGREPCSTDDWAAVQRIGLATSTAGRWVVDRARPCLPIALAAQTLLARRGFRAQLQLGVGASADAFEAHAWVECGGRCVVGRPGRPLVALR